MDVEYDSGECSEKRRVGEESRHLLREYVNNCVQIVGRAMNVKGDLVRSQMEIRNRLLKIGAKVIPVLKWQITLLNCVLLFCGRLNLQATKLNI